MTTIESAKEYWKDPEAFETRNLQIIKDRGGGMPILEICNKYQLSATRIFAIIRRHKLRKVQE